MAVPVVAVAAGAVLTGAALIAWKRRSAATRYQFESQTKPGAQPSPAQSAAYIVGEGRLVRGIDRSRNPPHWGIDVGAEIGTPVKAAKSGTVTHASPVTGYGNTVMISHDAGGSTLYGHLNDIAVVQGQHVSAGQTIGEVGRTSAGPSGEIPDWGHHMGAHLHMEVHRTPEPVLGQRVERLDPVQWLRREGIEPYARRS